MSEKWSNDKPELGNLKPLLPDNDCPLCGGKGFILFCFHEWGGRTTEERDDCPRCLTVALERRRG